MRTVSYRPIRRGTHDSALYDRRGDSLGGDAARTVDTGRHGGLFVPANRADDAGATMIQPITHKSLEESHAEIDECLMQIKFQIDSLKQTLLELRRRCPEPDCPRQL